MACVKLIDGAGASMRAFTSQRRAQRVWTPLAIGLGVGMLATIGALWLLRRRRDRTAYAAILIAGIAAFGLAVALEPLFERGSWRDLTDAHLRTAELVHSGFWKPDDQHRRVHCAELVAQLHDHPGPPEGQSCGLQLDAYAGFAERDALKSWEPNELSPRELVPARLEKAKAVAAAAELYRGVPRADVTVRSVAQVLDHNPGLRVAYEGHLGGFFGGSLLWALPALLVVLLVFGGTWLVGRQGQRRRVARWREQLISADR